MIVLPLDDARDLIDEFCRRNPLSSLVHCALVAALQRRVAVIVEQATTSVARLVARTTAHDIKDEGVARYLLVHLDLDYIAALDLTPSGDYKATRPF